jgi:hypothetical protein
VDRTGFRIGEKKLANRNFALDPAAAIGYLQKCSSGIAPGALIGGRAFSLFPPENAGPAPGVNAKKQRARAGIAPKFCTISKNRCK